MTKRVLVVSHEASRTGAPKVAEHLLTALGAGGWETVLVHRWGGPLRPEMDRRAARSLLEPLAKARVALRRSRRTKSLATRLERVVVFVTVRRLRPDLVWCNTALTSVYARAALAAGIPTVLYGHEQPELVRQAFRRGGFGPRQADDRHLTPVGCSSDAASALASVLGVGVANVRLLHSPVDVADLSRAAALAASPADRGAGPMVVACGTGDLRKGFDVFRAAALADAEAGSSTRWVWVGRVDDPAPGPVIAAGEVASALPWLAAADVVALPSRADAFPLVVLEAMALGKAVVASDIAGPREQLGDAAVFVPAGDASALRVAVAELVADPDRRARLGAAAAERCAQRWDVAYFGDSVRRIAADAVAPDAVTSNDVAAGARA